MKKFLFLFALVGLFVTSCSNNEIDEVSASKNDKAISFKTLRDKSVTRYANDGRNSFQVYAITTGDDDWYLNTPVTANAGSTTTTVNYYWPQGKTVDFYGFCPVPAAGNIYSSRKHCCQCYSCRS